MSASTHNAMQSDLEQRIRTGGFSLIELMISMALGLMLTLGMISVFSGNQRSTNLNAAITSLQENARFAIDSISRDVRMAGFQGCAPISGGSIKVLANDVPITDTVQGLRSTALWGSRINSATDWSPLPPWGTGSNGFKVPSVNAGIAGTYALALQFGDPKTYELNEVVGGVATPNPSGDIILKDDASVDAAALNVGDLALISDCLGGDMFRVTGVVPGTDILTIKHGAGASNNITGTLSTQYGSNDQLLRQTMVTRFNSRVYYVGDTGETDENGNTVTALYQQEPPFDNTNPAVEIVQGVEQFAVSFEVTDNLGRRTTVLAGDSAFDPSNVTAVRIGLLMASEEAIAEQDDNKIYSLAGIEVPPVSSAIAGQPSHAGDRRFRVAFNTTIKVRNFRDDES